jgi:hypothetical protein
MINALIHNATGSVLEWGAVQYVAGPGQSVVVIIDPGSFPEGEQNRYVRVAGGLFVAMTPAERAAVNLAIPQRRAQRVAHAAQVIIATGEGAPGGGWGNVIAPTTLEPLVGGAYQLVCGFELGLGVDSPSHAAQARLHVSGTEVGTWVTTRAAYTRFQLLDTFVYATGARPIVRLQIRRLGTPAPAAVARARRASIVLYPAMPILAEL